jgi:peptidyl-prolyl cis-trans isomerase B (cyclophilin B)
VVNAGIYVVQCGSPDGTGGDGPGYTFGPVENAPTDDLYPAGTLAMARVGGEAYSMGSQFFFVYRDSQILSDTAGGYTVFGRITTGLAILEAIGAAGTSDGTTDGAPVEPVLINEVSVE